MGKTEMELKELHTRSQLSLQKETANRRLLSQAHKCRTWAEVGLTPCTCGRPSNHGLCGSDCDVTARVKHMYRGGPVSPPASEFADESTTLTEKVTDHNDKKITRLHLLLWLRLQKERAK